MTVLEHGLHALGRRLELAGLAVEADVEPVPDLLPLALRARRASAR